VPLRAGSRRARDGLTHGRVEHLQPLQHGGAAKGGGHVRGGSAGGVARARVGAVPQQRPHQRLLTAAHRRMQRCGTRGVGQRRRRRGRAAAPAGVVDACIRSPASSSVPRLVVPVVTLTRREQRLWVCGGGRWGCTDARALARLHVVEQRHAHLQVAALRRQVQRQVSVVIRFHHLRRACTAACSERWWVMDHWAAHCEQRLACAPSATAGCCSTGDGDWCAGVSPNASVHQR